jgi:hypothetical protein
MVSGNMEETIAFERAAVTTIFSFRYCTNTSYIKNTDATKMKVNATTAAYMVGVLVL